MCVILKLLFLSYYCDYVVAEIAIFLFISTFFYSELVNFRRPGLIFGG
jgi:hypothetical protein